jgi:hypothetical protein
MKGADGPSWLGGPGGREEEVEHVLSLSRHLKPG